MESPQQIRRLRLLSIAMLAISSLPLIQCVYWHITEYGGYVDCVHRYNPFGGLSSLTLLGITLFISSYEFPTSRRWQVVLLIVIVFFTITFVINLYQYYFTSWLIL
jgi:hypothetical protein